VIVEEPRPAPESRTRAQVLLARTLRLVDAGPPPCFRAALVSLTATCVLSIVIALEIRPAGPLPGPQRDEIAISLAGLGVAGLLALATVVVPAARRADLLDRHVAPTQRAAIWLALALWFPLLCIIAYYRAEATLPLTQIWISFGYLDKRWLTAAYLIGALAPMVLLVGAARVLEAGRAHPASWRAWLTGLSSGRLRSEPATLAADTEPAEPATAQRSAADGQSISAVRHVLATRVIRISAGLLTALGLAWYFYGPPWYLNRTAGADKLVYQEDLYLSGLQAISKGAVPYIGPAAIQYGPGSQWFAYLYMRHIATFSVVGFREAWATFEWAGASLLFAVFFLALGYARGLFAALLSALMYPALKQLDFVPHGAYTGLFAWANPLRYAGAITLILLLPAAIRRAPAWRGVAGGLALGLVWGLLSYVAQENLLAGVVGMAVLAALLLLSHSAARRSVLIALLAVVAGFVVSWLPVVLFYVSKGLLGRFVYLYFLDVRAVAEGYSNTPFDGPGSNPRLATLNAPWVHMYYGLPFVLAALALAAVLRFGPLRVATQWSRDRILLVSAVVTTILLYQGTMLRADANHLTGTLLAVPLLVVAAATVLPRLLGLRPRSAVGLAGVLIFAASLLLLPVRAYAPWNMGDQAAAPTLDRSRLAATRVLPAPDTLAAQRVGAGVWARPACCETFSEPMKDFLELASRLHAIIGNRTTYVYNFMAGYTGVIYFVADLRPAPVPLDLRTMVFTEQQKLSYLSTFRSSVLPRTQALVTDDLRVAEVTAFERRYPHYQRIELMWHHLQGGTPYWVLLSSPEPAGAATAS
jgi:hypothetical protein